MAEQEHTTTTQTEGVTRVQYARVTKPVKKTALFRAGANVAAWALLSTIWCLIVACTEPAIYAYRDCGWYVPPRATELVEFVADHIGEACLSGMLIWATVCITAWCATRAKDRHNATTVLVWGLAILALAAAFFAWALLIPQVRIIHLTS